MLVKNRPGVAVATAAALIFGTSLLGTAVAAGTDAKVQCSGVNACKGQSACSNANNACKGQNSCKGKGFLEMTQKECDAAQAKMKSAGK